MAMPRTLAGVIALTCAPLLPAQDGGGDGRLLATIPDDLALSQTSRGPDGAEFTTRTRFVFGAAGSFVAYSAFRDGQGVAMANDEELGAFDFLHQPVADPASLRGRLVRVDDRVRRADPPGHERQPQCRQPQHGESDPSERRRVPHACSVSGGRRGADPPADDERADDEP